jgi:hypothetical protein
MSRLHRSRTIRFGARVALILRGGGCPGLRQELPGRSPAYLEPRDQPATRITTRRPAPPAPTRRAGLMPSNGDTPAMDEQRAWAEASAALSHRARGATAWISVGSGCQLLKRTSSRSCSGARAAGEGDRDARRSGRGQRRGAADCPQRLNVPISRACSMTWLAIRSSNARRSRPGSRSRSSSSA